MTKERTNREVLEEALITIGRMGISFHDLEAYVKMREIEFIVKNHKQRPCFTADCPYHEYGTTAQSMAEVDRDELAEIHTMTLVAAGEIKATIDDPEQYSLQSGMKQTGTISITDANAMLHLLKQLAKLAPDGEGDTIISRESGLMTRIRTAITKIEN